MAWLIDAIERLPPRARRTVVVAAASLLLAAAIASLTLRGSPVGGVRTIQLFVRLYRLEALGSGGSTEKKILDAGTEPIYETGLLRTMKNLDWSSARRDP